MRWLVGVEWEAEEPSARREKEEIARGRRPAALETSNVYVVLFDGEGFWGGLDDGHSPSADFHGPPSLYELPLGPDLGLLG